VLPPDSKLKREEREELRQEIHDTHGGVDQAFRLMLLSGGMDFKGMSQTAVEAELIEQRKLDREEVAAVYDIPPPLIGILDHATYSNVAEMHRMLYVTVLGPPLVMLEETIKAELIDPEPAWEGHFVEFDLSEVLKGDTLKEIQALRGRSRPA
jgi:HK97 family phage portal protein